MHCKRFDFLCRLRLTVPSYADRRSLLRLWGFLDRLPACQKRFFDTLKNGSRRSFFMATPHNSARTDFEKICVRKKALFRRNTLCLSRKSNAFTAQIFRKMPQTNCAVLPKVPVPLTQQLTAKHELSVNFSLLLHESVQKKPRGSLWVRGHFKSRAKGGYTTWHERIFAPITVISIF